MNERRETDLIVSGTNLSSSDDAGLSCIVTRTSGGDITVADCASQTSKGRGVGHGGCDLPVREPARSPERGLLCEERDANLSKFQRVSVAAIVVQEIGSSNPGTTT
ncbi:uncharacterized protein LOC119433263 [Dermacentor silvarum]|uniref:uncharacterized protein LOC119433263 n=1 Tax=Dermacentor silvarum TaxID=543639 RepID=UPI0018985B04|nr:uncharacterized protein LOC119433263 [Dermacentor silvarum]